MQNHPNPRIHPARAAVLGLLTVSLASCSHFNPYQRTELATVPLEKISSETVKSAGGRALAGHLDAAIWQVRDQQKEWYDSLSTQARTRAITQVGVLGLAAIAVYSVMKPGVASDTAKRNLVAAGAVGAAAYAGSDWYLNTGHEDSYIKGMRKLSCAMLEIEPFRMDAEYFANTFEPDIRDLTGAINDLDEALLVAQATLRYPEPATSPPAKVRKEAEEAGRRGRTTLAASQRLRAGIDTSGSTLRRESEFIFADVAADIRLANKSVSNPTEAFSTVSSIAKKIQAVGVDAEKEADPPDTKTPKSDLPAAAIPQAPASSTPTPNVPLGAATIEDLLAQMVKKMGAQYDSAIAALEKKFAQQIKDSKAAAEKASDAASVLADAQQRGVAACKKQGRLDCEPPADAVARDLAQKTAALYAARRPLSNQLLTFHRASEATKNNKECPAPADPAKAAADAAKAATEAANKASDAAKAAADASKPTP